jgi:hypothetical protein
MRASMSTQDQDNKQQHIKLIEIVRQTIERDEELRTKYDVQTKFRFVRDRLHALLANLESQLEIKVAEEKAEAGVQVGSDEVVVYVHLFNAHGATLSSWRNMLIPKVFYEYSVNRPVYSDKSQIESVVNSKANKAQHGYIAVAVKMEDVLKPIQATLQKDSYGNDLLKVKEGSLHFSRLILFMHNGIGYSVSEKGELIKKE